MKQMEIGIRFHVYRLPHGVLWYVARLSVLGLFSWYTAMLPSLCNTLNTLKLRQNWRHFTDDIFKCIFMNENVWISIKISLKFVPKGPINNIPAMVQIMAWRRSGDKPLSEPMMVSLLTHICVARPQWVKDRASIEKFPGVLFSNELQ